jgi:DNA-binding Lrp family transcriptional regulator
MPQLQQIDFHLATNSSTCPTVVDHDVKMTMIEPTHDVQLDSFDHRLIRVLRRHPDVSLSELARRLDTPRGTVQSRRQRLERRRVITGYGPDIDPSRVGYSVTAFTSLEIAQGAHDDTIAGLRRINEVIEIHTVTGAGDLLCRVIARSNGHLHEVLQRVTALPTVMRSQTQIALSTQLHRTPADVIAATEA